MPCTPMADRASRTSSSLNGLMIAVTSFMNELPEWVMDFETLELVEPLQRQGRHGLARRTRVVREHRAVRLVSASLDARFEAVTREERDRCSHFLVFRSRSRGEGRARRYRAETESVLVVDRLSTQDPPQLRHEHEGDVTRKPAELRLAVSAARQRRVVLTHGEVFQADGQRIDDRVGRDTVNARAGPFRATRSGERHGLLAR